MAETSVRAGWLPRNHTGRAPVAPPPDPAPADRPAEAPAPTGRASISLGLTLLAIFVVVLPVTFYELTPHRLAPDLALLFIALSIAVSGARLSVIIAGPRIRIFETVLWTFYYLFLGVAPLVQYVSLSWPATTPKIAREAVLQAGVIVVVSQICILLGLVLVPRRLRRDPDAGPVEEEQAVRKEQAVEKEQAGLLLTGNRLVALLGISLAAAVLYYPRIGIGNAFTSRDVTVALRSTAFGNPAFGVLIWACTCMPLLCVAVGLVLNWRVRRPTFAVQLATVLCVVVTLLVFNPLSNPRYVSGTAILAVLGSLGVYATVNRYRIFALLLNAGLLLVFPSLDLARTATKGSLAGGQEQGPMHALTTGDFDAFAQIANTYSYVHDLGITWGRQLLGVLLFWVPRQFWADKPIDTGVLLGEFRDYKFTNLSAPLPAEIFINFGWVGLLVLSFLVGRALLHLDVGLFRRIGGGATGGPLGYVLPFYLIILLRGSLLQATGYLAVLLFCFYVLRPARAEAPPG